MTRRLSLLAAILILLLCLCAPACATELPAPTPAVPTLTDNIILLFGSGEQETLDALGNPAISETKEARQQKTIRLDCVIGDAPVSAALTFYNDVLMACEYAFTDSGEAHLYASKCRDELAAALGEKTTYPEVTAAGRGYLDDLADVSQLQDMHVYYEDWTPEIDEAVIRQMIGDMEYSRTDLRLELSIYSSELAAVSMKYMVIQSSLK